MKVSLPQLNKVLEGKKDQSLFKLLRENDIPVASSCLGDGICGKCVLTIQKGSENLNPANELELKLSTKYHLKKEQRISCQCTLQGPIEVTSSYW